MPREITEDLSKLVSFIKEYSLENLSSNVDFNRILSSIHKKYYSLLTCIAELNFLSNDESIDPPINDVQIAYLTESSSDIGNAIFVMANGAYKPSKLMIRSSIETFMKGFCLDWYPTIVQEKSLYKMFDAIKILPFFQNVETKKIFDNIHTNYGILCEDTHTARQINMQQVTALSYFPRFQKQDAEKVNKFITSLVQDYLYLLCAKYNTHYHKMHHRNKENIIDSISKNLRPHIIGINRD